MAMRSLTASTDYMVTADEYRKILQSVYDRGYVLVDIADVWSEVTGEDGQPTMVRNTLYLPEGTKPLILSFDDTNYYEYCSPTALPTSSFWGRTAKSPPGDWTRRARK